MRQSYDESLMAEKDTLRPCAGSIVKCHKTRSDIRKSGKVFGQGQKAAKAIRAGLYARVSTQDQQTLPMQNKAMREYASRRDWTIAMQIKEVGSGASQRELRGS